MTDIPEHIRENISKLLDEALEGLPIAEKMDARLRHMLVSYGYLLHRAGMQAAFKTAKSNLERLEKDMT